MPLIVENQASDPDLEIEMDKKAYITDDLTATFECDKCGHARIEDVSRYVNVGRAMRVRCTCRCGHSFSVTLEKRKLVRKACEFMGRYTRRDDYGEVTRERVRVINISRGGLRLDLMGEKSLDVGDRLEVEFRLDDEQRSEIRKTVVVRNISESTIGTEFADSEELDKVLSMYLMA